MWIPGQEYAPSLDDLLGQVPAPAPVTPTFRASVEQLDLTRFAFLAVGILIGRYLFK